MTTIAWDGKTLAADSQITYGGLACTLEKIWRLNGGQLFGATGAAQDAYAVRYWLEDPSRPEPKLGDDFAGILILTDGSSWRLESSLIRMPITESCHALGSGRDFAIAGMALGLSAVQAVELAIRFDAYSSGEVTALHWAPSHLADSVPTVRMG